ncbi:hypothetical protein HELRODRAFT_76450, partial [Helobdella robusta]|uniref:EGF-like domain-containing protein n=1 Tax=Helobdella robusta TaxID=6412 RepID=T1G2K0_HELRO
DINECALKIDKCDKQTSYCENIIGSYRCVCKVGFQHISSNKLIYEINFEISASPDIDECAGINKCYTPSTKCVNTFGSYHCRCSVGYYNKSKSPDMCEDINECLVGHGCDPISTHCVNSFGGYQCLCRTGFKPFSELDCQGLFQQI